MILPRFTANDTIAAVAAHFNTTVDKLRDHRKRAPGLVDARAVAAWLLVTMHRMSLRKTGDALAYASGKGNVGDIPALMNRVSASETLGKAALDLWWDLNASVAVFDTAEEVGL